MHIAGDWRTLEKTLRQDMATLQTYLQKWRLKLSETKTESCVFHLTRISLFPDFQLPGKREIFRNFSGNPGKSTGSRKSRGFGKFPGKFPELDYLATREMTKTFFPNCIISNPTLSIFYGCIDELSSSFSTN